MKKATFIDFEDSFSYNVIQELTEIGFSVEAVLWKDLESLPTEGLLVLGPGPGHPDDYQVLFPLLKNWIDEKRPLFGICLGHQIFWRILGEDILRSKEPVHGQQVELQLNEEWKNWLGLKKNILVQRYNSLGVMETAAFRNPLYQNLIQDGEILITKGSHVITYQFHPESIGTMCRKSFMGPVFRDLV